MKDFAIFVAFALAAQFAVMGVLLWLFLPLGGTQANPSFNVQGWSAEPVENETGKTLGAMQHTKDRASEFRCGSWSCENEI